MPEEKDTKQKQEQKQESESHKRIVPGDIKGKIDVHDTRERRDGPGGD